MQLALVPSLSRRLSLRPASSLQTRVYYKYTLPTTRSQQRASMSGTASAETTSESAPKKARTEEKYQLFYWPGLPGRGEPIRLALEEAGADYDDVIRSKGVKTLTALVGGDKHFAPPVLRHGDIEISQLPNIMLYLGPKLKLVPEDDDEMGRLRVNQLFLTAMDLQNEAHDTHHPVATGLYYEDQKDAALQKAQDFRENRIPKYFKHFEAVLAANKASDGEWLVGENLTYADLGLTYVVEGLTFAFPRAIAALKPTYPKVFALHDRVKERPRLKAYYESDRRQQFSNGIYRHYDELDAPAEET